MSNQVLYRKYRPKDFSEVIGQEYAKKAITNALKSGRVAHAYLFSGPRGIGKTSIARLIAKAANCIGKGERPCNSCEICVDMNDGRFMDLIEIDAASNRSIDDIRELREAVRFVPSRGKYKVYIIDECHMLTKEAFNALLKTLEEPPEHAIFILATTEFDKLPATIVSRTQHYHLTRPTISDIAKKLLAISKTEKVKLDPDAADLIALASEGALRDAESVLGQIMALEDGHITRTEVEQILGFPRRDAVRELFDHIGNKDAKSALEAVNALSGEGFDFYAIIIMLMKYVRNGMVLKSGAGVLSSMEKDLLPQEIEFLKANLDKWSQEGLSRALNALMDAHLRMKQSPIPELPLELAIVEITTAKS
jgi:DNA polymerase-3 subunit gamma/tau